MKKKKYSTKKFNAKFSCAKGKTKFSSMKKLPKATHKKYTM